MALTGRFTQCLGAAAFVAVGMGAGAASAEMSPNAVAAKIAGVYDVNVLRTVETTTDDGRKAYRLTVMQDGDVSNSTFAVTTVVADAETGELIRQFRHKSSGYQVPGAPRFTPGLENMTSGGGTNWR
ncbi:MAG: hypothetical protein AAF220_08910 [Pseudomonadota bacterium]